jgi:2-oxoisovalerate dehydrogenase E1 component
MEAAQLLSDHYGVEAEVIDARSLVPFDYEPVIASVRKTGRILLTSDASERGSFLGTMAANIQALAFDYLDAPVTIVGARNWITPPTEMETCYFPQPSWLLDAIHRNLLPLPGYAPTAERDVQERMWEARRGV